MKSTLTYKSSGVDYSAMDPLKKLAQKMARKTSNNLSRFKMQEIEVSRGESAYVWEEKNAYKAIVIEGLGTKNLVADETRKITGRTFYDQIAQDTVAMIVNDLIVVGAEPQVVNAYFAVGDSDWFLDKKRTNDLVKGWAKACNLAGAVWGGGETPTLKGIINPNTIDLSGAAVGIILPKKRLILGDKLKEKDAIVLIESSGIHANGLTLARAIADKLPNGYATVLSNGKKYGEVLLTPTHIYAPLVQSFFENDIDIHYMVNITGHGWRKLMRANRTFTYRLHTTPPIPEEFKFIQQKENMSDESLYDTFNMGAGFALIVPQKQVQKLLKIAKRMGFKSWNAGVVEKGPKQVIIEPKNIVFAEDSLQIR